VNTGDLLNVFSAKNRVKKEEKFVALEESH
jgi:hypothetical protein